MTSPIPSPPHRVDASDALGERDALSRVVFSWDTDDNPNEPTWTSLNDDQRDVWRSAADAILASDWLATHDARIRREGAKRVTCAACKYPADFSHHADFCLPGRIGALLGPDEDDWRWSNESGLRQAIRALLADASPSSEPLRDEGDEIDTARREGEARVVEAVRAAVERQTTATFTCYSVGPTFAFATQIRQALAPFTEEAQG